MFQFACTYCAEIIETASVSELQDRGRTHLNDHHSDLADAFRERVDGSVRVDVGVNFRSRRGMGGLRLSDMRP
jgi:hypothetical protein